MNIANAEQITIVSILITGISVLWAYFTKLDAKREKETKEEVKERENILRDKVTQKDDLIVQMARDTTKALTEIKGALDNNTMAITNSSGLTKQVLDELVRIKLLNGRT